MPQNVITGLTYHNPVFLFGAGGNPVVIGHNNSTVPDYNDLSKIEQRALQENECLRKELYYQEMYHFRDELMKENQKIKKEIDILIRENEQLKQKITALIGYTDFITGNR